WRPGGAGAPEGSLVGHVPQELMIFRAVASYLVGRRVVHGPFLRFSRRGQSTTDRRPSRTPSTRSSWPTEIASLRHTTRTRALGLKGATPIAS
ncbi:MAG: hypothetical protein AVDCRST_MAG01-01-4088, partial [uncultured Rubrobacteraceae bacterium]